jgi:hypothetical protein
MHRQVGYVQVLLCRRADGSFVVIKDGFVEYELQAELQAYELLEPYGQLLFLLPSTNRDGRS